MQPLPNRAEYVHVRVRCVGRKSIANCAGWITSLERLDRGRTVAKLTGSRPLIWAPREQGITHTNIQPGIPQDLDIFRTVENVNVLELLSVGHPQRWVTFFSVPGTYGLRIMVSGEGSTKSIRLIVTWRGNWNNFDVVPKKSWAWPRL